MRSHSPTSPRKSRAAGVRLAAAIVVLLGGVATMSASSSSATPSRHGNGSDVMANLFEWNWNSVAKECTTVLGPAGYGGVQVAPPQDSVKRTALGNGSDTILHPWWEVYQAVDYNLTSRMGDEAQFKSMVTTCRKAGVKVYVDAVINHMTGQGNVSYGGVTFDRYNYPGIYTQQDFHKFSGDCPSASGGIEDFNNQQQVFKCELLGLADLRTETDKVRSTLAAYLNKLIGYGVSGFRVDAAKHIGQSDLQAIYSRLHRTIDGTRPYWALEVFGGGPGTLSPQAFTTVGNVLGLDAVKQIRDAFKSYPADHVGSIATLRVFGAGSGLTPSDRTLSFVQNHDTERNGDALNYKDGATNIIANEFLLAYGYGRPQVYSGFAWTTSDDSPPSDANGLILDADCATTYVCIDRDKGVQGAVRLHNAAKAEPVRNWWDDGANLIAFSRGDRGWITINNGTAPKTATIRTGMPRGTYCDIIHGSTTSRHGCSGQTIQVDRFGNATVTVPAKDSLAFTASDRVRS